MQFDPPPYLQLGTKELTILVHEFCFTCFYKTHIFFLRLYTLIWRNYHSLGKRQFRQNSIYMMKFITPSWHSTSGKVGSHSRKMTFFHFFSIWVLFPEHSRITGLQGKRKGIPWTPHYHFHPLYRNLDISRAITAESSPLHIASSRTRTGNHWFPSASR